MKTKLISILFTATLLGGSVVANAANSNNVNDLKKRTMFLERQVRVLQTQIDTINTGNKSNYDLDLLVEMYAHGPAIVTSPALGIRRSAEDAKDLMVNLPSVNEDLVLLKLRQKMDNYALENNIPIPQRPIISMSGAVEGKINNKRVNGQADRADINFSRAELDVIGEAGPWATAAMIIAYEDKAINGTRVSNSRLKLDRGFLTIGQLNQFPAYFTIGQVFAPFGKYSSYMVTNTSTKLLGRQKDRMLVLGFNKWGITAQAYGFPGETKVVDSNNFFHHAGFNLDYEYSQDEFKINVGGSIMGNFAETDGMQNNIFANAVPVTERIQSAVKGVDGRIKASYDMFTVLAEYVGAIDRFNATDLYFDNNGLINKGAKPQAFSVEGAVEFTISGKPNNFAVGYGRTWEALALNLPKHTFFAEYNVSLLKNTILSFEYRHDIGYAQDEVGGSVLGGVSKVGSNSHTNTITAQLGIYF